jgi:hypothetical protein
MRSVKLLVIGATELIGSKLVARVIGQTETADAATQEERR